MRLALREISRPAVPSALPLVAEEVCQVLEDLGVHPALHEPAPAPGLDEPGLPELLQVMGRGRRRLPLQGLPVHLVGWHQDRADRLAAWHDLRRHRGHPRHNVLLLG